MLGTSEIPLCLLSHALQYTTSLFFLLNLTFHVYYTYLMLCYKHPETFTQIACLLLFSCQVVPNYWWPQGLQHTRPLCPSPHHLSQFAQVHAHWIDDAISFVPKSVILVSLFLCSFWWQPEQLEDWSQMKSIQSQAWGSCLAVDYDLDWGCWPECLSVASPCGLTGLMTRDRETGFKEEHLKRKLDRNCGDFSSLIVMHCQRCRFLFFRRKQ